MEAYQEKLSDAVYTTLKDSYNCEPEVTLDVVMSWVNDVRQANINNHDVDKRMKDSLYEIWVQN